MVTDVAEADFQREVLDRSHEMPVVVDFWAPWCGPCRALTPALEKAAAAREGEVVLAKVNTDENQRVSQSFGIQGIPAVKAFKDGKVVDEFTGAVPPAQVERFFDGLVPSEAERLMAAGGEADLRRALELEPANNDAAVRLARLLLDRGEPTEAAQVVDGRPGFPAEGLAARIRLEPDPALAPAFRALDEGETESGLETLITALAEAGDAERKEDLRRAVVAVLDGLGVEHPLARESRRRLAAALY
jgi:putative thioredoxin